MTAPIPASSRLCVFTRLLAFLVFLSATVMTLTSPAPAQGFAASGPMVDASLISDRTGVEPGETFHLALHQDITEGWHTYWINPGDSGEQTRVTLQLPEGWTAGDIIWPAPKAYDLGPLTNYGYSNAVTLPIPVSVAPDAPRGRITIPAEATWLVCEDICIPESGEFEITLDVGEARIDAAGAQRISVAFEAAPVQLDGVQSGLRRDADSLVLTVAGEALGGEVRNVSFFPVEGSVIDHNGEQVVATGENALRMYLEPGFGVRGAVEAVHPGVLVFEQRTDRGWSRRAIEISPQPEASVADIAAGSASAAPTGGSVEVERIGAGVSFLQAALLALVGGLILNLMPCVFPVLSMKALQLVNKRDADAGEARTTGVFFLFGVLATFLALAGGLLALRSVAGLADISWGYQLQEPWVVAFLASLMFLIGLNFLGVFEIGASLQGVGGQIASDGRSGAFLTGVLAVFVAAPCVAPFMTTALAYALGQPALAALAIFAFLGLGLALPFVLVSFFPRLLALLPKPGAWMDRFKQFLAFPMFATAIWLIWVLGVQTGANGVALLLAGLLSLAFAVWALKASSVIWKVLGGAAALGALALVWSTSSLGAAPVSGASGVYANWSPQAVETAQAEGRPVFVDFTAAWCVTCQYNKQTALADGLVNAAFAEAGFELLRADFTNRDPEIAAVLARHGAAGVPLYLVYPQGGGEPEVLPPLLTASIVIQAIDRAVQ
ncbi:MAG: thioredoxin family protein [Pseudomonadota bacterium]